mmetsp:Transcript_9131/g.22767  ORF Transcript_9131/g.22767 Transcript_9131/m.22767 type:complete len:382 (+) Transcript_9131:40-1185(+)
MSSTLLGAFLNVIAGVLVAGDMLLNVVMTRLGRPYWSIMAIALIISSCVVAAHLVAARKPRLAWHKVMWVVLRGTLGGTYWILSIVAVQEGAPPGDVAALTSINIIAAALLGRAFLGEDLRLPHMLAVVSSIAGAMLITQPSFLFGRVSSLRGVAWLGHFCAAASGITQSLAYITSRKVADVSVGFHTLSSMAASAVIACVIPFTPIAHGESPVAILNHPFESMAWIAAAFALATVAVLLACAGALLCPVAVSVTVYTAASMLAGYSVQIMIVGKAPNLTTIVGAALMLLAVLLMTMARVQGASGGAVETSDSPPTKLADENSEKVVADGQSIPWTVIKSCLCEAAVEGITEDKKCQSPCCDTSSTGPPSEQYASDASSEV